MEGASRELSRLHPEMIDPESARRVRLSAIRHADIAADLAAKLEKSWTTPSCSHGELHKQIAIVVVAQWVVIFGLLAALCFS